MTEEQLSAIDVIVSGGLPTITSIIHPDVDLLDDTLRAEGFLAYACLPDFKSRRPYERSLWLWREDGRCVPELYALATLRYGALPSNMIAYWQDGHASNRTLENVMLVKVPEPGQDGRIRGNKFGVKAGTPEYRKLYYSRPENRERQKSHSRNSAARKRSMVSAARGVTDPQKLQEMCLRILLPDGRKGEEDDRLFNLLNDPQVVQRLINSAHLLMSIVDDITFDEALTQSRDKYLDALTGQVQETSVPTDQSENS